MPFPRWSLLSFTRCHCSGRPMPLVLNEMVVTNSWRSTSARSSTAELSKFKIHLRVEISNVWTSTSLKSFFFWKSPLLKGGIAFKRRGVGLFRNTAYPCLGCVGVLQDAGYLQSCIASTSIRRFTVKRYASRVRSMVDIL